MFSLEANILPGTVNVHTTEHRGHSPEELAEMAMDKIIHVSGDMPPAIRDQVEAYKDRLRAVLIFYLKQAQASERTTICVKLEKAGLLDVAEELRSI